jgi:hypothetical protein
MQKLHRWLADPPVGLHEERDKAVAVGLHSCVCRPLLLVPVRGCRPGCDRGRVLMERGWMTERLEMVIPRGSAVRMPPLALGRRKKPSAAIPAPSARPRRRRRGGSRADAMPVLCTTRRKSLSGYRGAAWSVRLRTGIAWRGRRWRGEGRSRKCTALRGRSGVACSGRGGGGGRSALLRS